MGPGMRLQSLLSLAILALVPACAPSVGSEPGEQVSGDADAVKQCAEGATVRGVDVSYYQGDIDWNAAHSAGIAFAITRVSDGKGFKDPTFAQNWKGMRDAGVVRGLYQFFRPKQDPIAQADLAIAMLNDAGGLQKGDLPLMLDIEVNDGVAPGTILARAQTWLEHVQAVTGVVPMIYTGPGYWAQFGAPGGFDAYPLVVANWETSCPHLPASWPRWTFWQDADNGKVPGIDTLVDTDVFNGSLDDLLAFAGGAPSGGTGGDPAPSDPGTPPEGSCGTLVPNQSLGADQGTSSCDGRFTLVQQSDGNLVLYSNKEGALWASGTDGTDGRVAVMQEDGNLVVYTPEGKPVWDSGTWGHPGAWLAIQDDGNLVVYSGGKALWDSGTYGH